LEPGHGVRAGRRQRHHHAPGQLYRDQRGQSRLRPGDGPRRRSLRHHLVSGRQWRWRRHGVRAGRRQRSGHYFGYVQRGRRGPPRPSPAGGWGGDGGPISSGPPLCGGTAARGTVFEPAGVATPALLPTVTTLPDAGGPYAGVTAFAATVTVPGAGTITGSPAV